MPRYNYVALDSRGNETKGSIEVGSQNEAIGRVKDMGLFPTKINEADKEEKGSAKKGKAKAHNPKAAAHSRKRWRSIQKFSTACSSTWSRPANLAVCWKLF